MVTLRAYQQRARVALRGKSGIIACPAGGGKTFIAAAALADFCESVYEKAAGFWIANTQEQVEQARAAIAHFPIIAQRLNLTVCCYASVPNCTEAVVIVLDECHHIASPEYRKCLDGVGIEVLVWGFYATPYRADELRSDVFRLIGPILETIFREELIQAGNLAKARVRFHSPNSVGEITRIVDDEAKPLIAQRLRQWRFVPEADIRKRTIWQLVQKYGIFENTKRNLEIVVTANSHMSDSMLILIGSIEHGELIQSSVVNSVVAHSKMGAKKRRDAMADFRNGDLKCMIATSLADEGLDLPRANVLIMAAGGRSKSKTEQRTGRVLRTWGEKTHGMIHDFTDLHHYFLTAQSKARRSIYQQLGYEIES